MTAVKNKVKLCEANLSDFSIEQINGVPFYTRYSEIVRIFKKYISSVDFEQSFAQPCENKTKKVVEWFYVPKTESPIRLSDLKGVDSELHATMLEQRKTIVNAIKDAISNVEDSARKFLLVVLEGIDNADTTTYCCDGKILFGVWGMRAKSGRRMEDVIRENVLDHRVFSINYSVEGKADLSFTSIGRKYGYKLSTIDVPTVTPIEGWKFSNWKPNIPQGSIVTADLNFIAVCEKLEVSQNDSFGFNNQDSLDNDVGSETKLEDLEKEKLDNEESEKKYTVIFKSETGGHLDGRTSIIKQDGEEVQFNEIPNAIPDDGYEFVGWDKNPNGYLVHENIEFLARFQKRQEEKQNWFLGHVWFGRNGCLHALLNWILLALGIVLLFLLLWCFIFDKCYFDLCGCDCEETTAPINPSPIPNSPVQNPCNTSQEAGGEQGYMGYFDMGQKSGSFMFEYETQSVPDRIQIYDGKGTSGKVIFLYEGGTGGWRTESVFFSKRIVTVQVEGLGTGTAWEFKINCPNN